MIYCLILINFFFISGALATKYPTYQEKKIITHHTEISTSVPVVPEITLPDDQKQWQQAVLNYYSPVLADNDVSQKLTELLPLMIPEDEKFPPSNIKNIIENIKSNYVILRLLNIMDDPKNEQIIYLEKIICTYKKYLSK